MSWVGKPLERVEDESLLRGRGRFLDDLDPVPGAYHAAVVRSPYAAARITRIDISAALGNSGVLGVVTGRDIAGSTHPFPAVIDTPIEYRAAAEDEVRYAGEPVAVVVARDRYLAEDAAEMVLVDYEPLTPVLTPIAAVAAGSIVSDRSFTYGDPITLLGEADLVVKETFTFPRWTGAPMECFGVVADWSPAEGALTVWANFQGPFTLHMVAAAALGLPGSKLRLITPPDSGGSFGVKAAVYASVVLMGAVSRHLGVPVRWIEDRLEHLAASSAATERVTEVTAGFTDAGELISLGYDVVEDVGAYLRAPEPATLYRMHGSLSGAYKVRDVSARNRVVLTNRCPTGLNRGFGGPQLYFALESTMAIAAARLGIDPVDMARRNLVDAAQFPYTTPTGTIYDSGDYPACLDDALSNIGYAEHRRRQIAGRQEGRLLGMGIGCVVEPSVSNMGYVSLAETAEERARSLPKSGNTEGATIAMSPSGGVVVQISTTPQGQGHRTVASQVVADQLGLEPGDIEVVGVLDTHINAWSVASGNYSSRFSGMGVAAVQKAAQELAAAIKQVAADELECATEDIELRAGKAFVVGQPDAAVSLRRVAGKAHWNPEALPDGVAPGLRFTSFVSAPNLEPAANDDTIVSSAAHGFVVDVAVVEVDRDTGAVTVLDYATTHDAGTLLNPRLVDGQIQGGFAHGAGVALLERLAYDEDGNLITASFMDYLCMTAPEVPPLRSSHIETPSPFTALGAKGLGEGNTMSAPVTIANAVRDALGLEHVELPLTPPRVWELLEAMS
jgi:2-furoyl-CoA dehydrogenase large subunit